jgi:N-acetylmuramoyl-L-alanine amidase
MASRFWSPGNSARGAGLLLALGAGTLSGCRTAPVPPSAVPAPVVAAAPPPVVPLSDVIIAAGQRFHTGTRVITWLERDGYNAYRVVPRPAGKPALALKDYDVRQAPSLPGDKGVRKSIPAGLGALQGTVDQLVLHYDNIGLSQLCFEILQRRGLSTHFMIDVDGTVYQTLDLQERALHATVSNSRAIGIELANLGAYPPADVRALAKWYQPDTAGKIRLRVPADVTAPRIHTADFTGRPARPDRVRGVIQGQELVQYDYTPEQYAALAKLTAALCRVFPLLKCDYPRDADGRLVRKKLSDAALEKYRGILGHYHIQDNKTDPGPAFDWDKLINDARKL